MVEDIVRSLGYGTLGSRLKRIGEKLQAQTQEISEELAAPELPTSHNPVLAALDRNGPLSIGHLAEAIGQSQPGVTRMVNSLKSAGLVKVKGNEKDRRISRITLTRGGKALVKRLQETFWPEVMLAVEDACTGLSGTLLEQLDQLESALADRPLKHRRSELPLPDWDELLEQKGKAT